MSSVELVLGFITLAVIAAYFAGPSRRYRRYGPPPDEYDEMYEPPYYLRSRRRRW